LAAKPSLVGGEAVISWRRSRHFADPKNQIENEIKSLPEAVFGTALKKSIPLF